ncbi:MAG: transposase [Saprospiraceae bacterium]|nr:transposase [Saprospiraceae bacterium]
MFTDQGSQFTAAEFTATVLDNNIKLSMDGKGRAMDNVFMERFLGTMCAEHVYLNPTNDGHLLFKGIHAYMNYSIMERRHESLNYCTPYSQYQQNTNKNKMSKIRHPISYPHILCFVTKKRKK